jgi:two-component system cell cycle sensor histidine kinase PleC
MISGPLDSKKYSSLMNEYASLLSDAVLRHRARTAEHSARVEAELASKLKSDFIANMSHELRTPLNSIMGFSELLSEHAQRKLSQAEIIEYANHVHDAAGHLLVVINNILDISELQTGNCTLDAGEVELSEILTASVSSFRLMAQRASINLNHSIDVNLPTVRGDSVKLRQALSSLISNAIRFTGDGGTVSIDANGTTEGGVSICITDTGVGMGEDDIVSALTPFDQLDASKGQWPGGAGLGLPVAQALVQLHGGNLKVESELNVGTRVEVTLPPGEKFSVTEARDIVMGQGLSS